MVIVWKKFRSYSGPVRKGERQIRKPHGDREDYHVDRAYWLTTQVETGGRMGAIMAADGTAMTAGLDQHVAVYPRDPSNQGGLWQLMRRLETVDGGVSYTTDIQRLWGMLADEGWYVAQDGVLRYTTDQEIRIGGKRFWRRAGDAVDGRLIRNAFTPMGGKVPKEGERWKQAYEWAYAFASVTDAPETEKAQVEFGKEHLVARAQRIASTTDPAYQFCEITSLRLGLNGWSEPMDLAMCMYQAHSVNAPAIARKRLQMALSKTSHRANAKFAKMLIKLLGNCKYGRWDDDIKHGRYQRTRSAARASGLWSRKLFDGPTAIMPKYLPG